jgi:hypothetical protein
MSYPLPRTVRSKRYRFRSAQERRQDRARRFGKVGFHVGPLEPVATARRRRTALFGDPRAVEMVSYGHRDGTVVVTARFGQVEACGLRDQPTGQACGPSRAESARARDCWGSPCDARHIGGCAYTRGGSDGGYRSAPPATDGRRQASLPPCRTTLGQAVVSTQHAGRATLEDHTPQTPAVRLYGAGLSDGAGWFWWDG